MTDQEFTEMLREAKPAKKESKGDVAYRVFAIDGDTEYGLGELRGGQFNVAARIAGEEWQPTQVTGPRGSVIHKIARGSGATLRSILTESITDNEILDLRKDIDKRKEKAADDVAEAENEKRSEAIKKQEREDAIREVMAKQKPKRTKIDIKTGKGNVTDVPAVVFGDYAVHKTLSKDSKAKGTWVATHVPSGIGVTGSMIGTDRDSALELAYRYSLMEKKWGGAKQEGREFDEFFADLKKEKNKYENREPITKQAGRDQ